MTGGVDIATLGLHMDGRQLRTEAASVDRSLQGIGKTGDKLKRTMGQLGVTMSAALFARAAIRRAGEFQGAMTQSLAIMGDVDDMMRNRMAESAKRMGIELNLGAKEAAESYFFLASAGLSAEQSLAALPQVAAFAKAGMFNMATATDLATDAQSALGLTVKDAVQNLENMTRVTDVLVKGNILANATVQQFSEALTSEAGAALKTFGKDIEEGVAVLAAFADQGVKGQVAGTGLSRILRLMTSAAVQNKDAMNALGIEVFNAQGNVNNMADIIEDLEVAFRDMSDAERVAALEAIGFQARVQGVILPLIGASDAIRTYEAKLREAGGETKEIADNQMKAPLERVGSAMKELATITQDAGDVLLKILVPAAEFAARHVNNIKDAAVAVTVAIGTAGTVAAIVALVKGLKAFVSLQAAQAFFQLALSIRSVSEALALAQIAMGPTGWLIAGVTAIAAAVFLWRRRQRELNAVIDEGTSSLNRYRQELGELEGSALRAQEAGLKVGLEQARLLLRDLENAESDARGGRGKEGLAEYNRINQALEAQRKLVRDLEVLYNDTAEAAKNFREEAGAGDAPDDRTTSSRSAAAEALQLEIDRQRALNEAFFDTQKEIDLLNLAYDERAQLMANASEFTGAELEVMNRLTREIFEQKRAYIELEAAQNEAEAASRRRSKEREEAIERERRAIEAREEAERKAAEDAAQIARAPYEEAAKNFQNAMANTFRSIREDGLDSFEDLANSILNIFSDLAAEIAALLVAEKLGLDELLSKIKTEGIGAVPTWARLGASAAIGVGIGAGTGNPAVGAIGGAAAGFATGGPAGAVLGGVAGLVSGLFGQAKRAREAAEKMRKAQEAFSDRIDDMIADVELAGGTDIDRRIENIRKLMRDAITEFGETFDVGFIKASKAFDANGLAMEEWMAWMETTRRGLGNNQAAIEEWDRVMELARKSIEQFEEEIRRLRAAFDQELAVRRLVAAGRDEEADAMRRQIENEKEIAAARQAGMTETQIETLKAVQAEEALAEVRRKAVAELERLRSSSEDLTVRALSAAGRGDDAAIARLNADHRRELREAKDEGRSVAEVNAIKAVQDIERAALEESIATRKAIEDIEKRSVEQVNLLDEQLRVANEELQVAQSQLAEQERLVDTMQKVVSTLGDFSDSLLLSPNSPLSPFAKLQEARSQFDAMRSLAMGGDLSAAQSLPNAARALLEASRDFNASGPAFVSDFNFVRESIGQVQARFADQATIEEQILEELRRQTENLVAQIERIQQAKEEAQNNAQRQIDEIRNASEKESERLNALLAEAQKQIDELRKLIEWQQMGVALLEQLRDSPGILNPPPPPGLPPEQDPTNWLPSMQSNQQEMNANLQQQTRVLAVGFEEMNKRIERVESAAQGTTNQVRRSSEDRGSLF